MIECRVLGPVDVTVKGGPAPPELLWRKHLALLVYLARSPKRARTREHLCGLLWPEKDESAARHSLNEAMRVLRRAGLGDSMDTSGGQVRLTGSAPRLDADRLDGLVANASWGEAAALVAGEFLEGFSVEGCPDLEDWIAAERRHWTGRSLVALLGWSGELLRQGRSEEALAAARRAESLDPGSDAVACAVMSGLAAAGETSAALAHVERFAATLRRELGSEPAEETLRLAERIRHGKPRSREPAVRPAVPEHRRAPLVGRSTELGGLLDLFERGRATRTASVVVLEGESGTGKSRLLDEFSTRVALAGGSVAMVRAVEADASVDGSVLIGLGRGGLLAMPGLPAAPPEALAGFAAVLPEWTDRFGVASAKDAMSPARAFGPVLSAAVGEGPVLLVVDDAQWADRTSLLALLAALRDLAQAPLTVLLATLPHPPREELDELRRRLGGELSGMALTLPSFGAAEIRQLSAWALPAYEPIALERVCRRVMSDSAGIPFLVVELLSAVAQGLDLRQGNSAWPAPLHTLTQSLPADLPDTIVAALRIGFRRLGQDAREVLAAAAILGDRVTDRALAAATGMPASRVEAALVELEWQRWLEMDGQGYGFVASLARRVVSEDMMTPGQRRRVRERSGLPSTLPPEAPA